MVQLFPHWKFRFVFDPQLQDLQLLVLIQIGEQWGAVRSKESDDTSHCSPLSERLEQASSSTPDEFLVEPTIDEQGVFCEFADLRTNRLARKFYYSRTTDRLFLRFLFLSFFLFPFFALFGLSSIKTCKKFVRDPFH